MRMSEATTVNATGQAIGNACLLCGVLLTNITGSPTLTLQDYKGSTPGSSPVKFQVASSSNLLFTFPIPVHFSKGIYATISNCNAILYTERA